MANLGHREVASDQYLHSRGHIDASRLRERLVLQVAYLREPSLAALEEPHLHIGELGAEWANQLQYTDQQFVWFHYELWDQVLGETKFGLTQSAMVFKSIYSDRKLCFLYLSSIQEKSRRPHMAYK